MIFHQLFMQRCIDLAQKGMGAVAPNPMVGAVLVHENRIIGEGWHQQFGGPHAEVHCIQSVANEDKQFIPQSTLYVSLEPCNHFGKTPPCSDLIIKSQIKKVVIACKDPFEKVNGSGIKKLEDNKVEVITGILEKEAIQLNKRFFIFHQQQMPYVILKWAESADGFIAKPQGKPVKISNYITDKLVHKWRSEEAAIIVGTNTVLNDNPSLTTRNWQGKNPLRIYIDKRLRVDAKYKILDNSTDTLILNLEKNEKVGVNEFVMIHEEKRLVEQLLQLLYKKGIQSLIVEGGTNLLQSFIETNYWHEARVIKNTELILQEGISSPTLKNKIRFKQESIRKDEINYYLNPTI
jgi:diaminohydroxyphosphoribosylaminopyrimidine deaminase / 5-amino-6-(5-phosphoribosylamino)uracil reductase